jgi:glucose-6-phosphate 1-dehydrogenase
MGILPSTSVATAAGLTALQPCVLVIFGATGDLSWRKLLPAMYNLNVDGVLPSNFAVVGFGRRAEAEPDQWLRERARDGLVRFSRRPIDEARWADFARRLFLVSGNYDDVDSYRGLKQRLDEIDREFGVAGGRVFYLAVPPQVASSCVTQLHAAGMVSDPSRRDNFTRVIVEKPIGHDLASAQEMNAALGTVLAEGQTYRIDHYLGKETVQNIMVLRFANSVLEPLWNHKYVDHVQITVAEQEGVGGRVGYYEGVGALRDMVQNHLLQVLCLTAMEPPWTMESDVVRDAKLGVLRCLRPLTPPDVAKHVVRGRYSAGDVGGKLVAGYDQEIDAYHRQRREPRPGPSTTETYVALRLFIDNWRWAGVPFYIRTGKRLPKRASEIAVRFRDVPHMLFNAEPNAPLEPNVLLLRLQPDEGFSLKIASKRPGAKLRIEPVAMDFDYASRDGSSPESYERLILDVMAGDSTLFMRRDAVDAAWRFVMPILDEWNRCGEVCLPEYRAGTGGPAEADHLIESDGRRWRTL